MEAVAEERRRTLKTVTTPEALAHLKAIAKRWGMKEYAVSGHIITWFAAQDDLFQRAVMGMLEGLEVDAARAYMERLAAAGKDDGMDVIPPTPEQVAAHQKQPPPSPKQGKGHPGGTTRARAG